MAWPLTPLTTYTASSTPAIKSVDLNSFQSAINGVYAGTLSLFSLKVDGVGGAAIGSPVAGTILSTTQVSRSAYLVGAGAGDSAWSIGFSNGVWTASGTGKLFVPLSPLLYSAVASITLTGVDFFCTPAGTNMQFNVMSEDVTVPSAGSSASVTSSGTSYQTKSVSGLSLVADATHALYLMIVSANNGDQYYGARITYKTVVF